MRLIPGGVGVATRVPSVVVLAALITVFGYASPAQARGSARSKTKPVAVVLNAEQVPAALLALGDFPAGWSSFAQGATLPPASATGGICNGPNVISFAQDAGVVADAVTTFIMDPAKGPSVANAVFSFPNAAAAMKFVTANRNAVTGCTAAWETPVPNQPAITIKSTIAKAPFEKVGDQLFASRQITTNEFQGQPGATTTSDSVFVRRGNNVELVGRTGSSLLGPGATDPSELATYTQKALSKLDAATHEAKTSATTTTTTTKKK